MPFAPPKRAAQLRALRRDDRAVRTRPRSRATRSSSTATIVGAAASCPARHWIARYLAKTLDKGPVDYVRFHLDEIGCEWCQANLDDLARADGEAALAPLLEKVEASTAGYLRSRAQR